ncbi:MAG: FAD-dependent monooxygenase [Chitinophagaceae bacterium]|nr:FAD-dependent monooxygenase [Chitinophagaceae bacterium]MBK8785601.1 FAD-dependent monooxygenase [Chitinophagaceae bacterium]MBL0199476.1 FAD-dependent monooxygenase [Chitinophagaceae bacterium]
MNDQYDVVVLGGGLAGLTLSLQLKNAKPDISILVLERRETEASTAAHKVGESTVELGTHYLREVLDLKGYLEEHELPKHGLRFFFKNDTKEDITSRVELGPRLRLPVPSHQLDRGTLENYLMKLTREKGNQLELGAKVSGVEISTENGHEVSYIKGGEEIKVKCRWVADASGRASVLKRKFQLQKPIEHHANAAWWRLKGVIDIDTWTDNKDWQGFLEPGLRYLSTVHFMDSGYWLWIIPLGSKNTSIGIVADPAIHPFDTFNTYEKAVEWMRVNEPLAHKMLVPLGEGEGLMDFKILKHYAHHTQKVYSTDRWGTAGESGPFLDPLYSPGTDFIAMNNGWLSDLILRDLAGEDIETRVNVYEQCHLALVDAWIPIYQNKYLLMGNTQIMVIKIFWDWAVYWAVPCHLFANKAFNNIRVLRDLFAAKNGFGRKFGELHKIMQDLFLEWLPYEHKTFSNRYIDPFDLKVLRKFQEDIEVQHEPNALIEQIGKNMDMLEQLAVAIFRLVSAQVNGTSPDIKVNPYTINLGKKEGAVMLDTESDMAIAPGEAISKDVEVMWFYPKVAVEAV